ESFLNFFDDIDQLDFEIKRSLEQNPDIKLISAEYRFESLRQFFGPMHEVDRLIRPEYWDYSATVKAIWKSSRGTNGTSGHSGHSGPIDLESAKVVRCGTFRFENAATCWRSLSFLERFTSAATMQRSCESRFMTSTSTVTTGTGDWGVRVWRRDIPTI